MDVAAIHALRALDGLGALESSDTRKVLGTALSHPSGGVVRTAIEVMPRDDRGRDMLLDSDVFESADAQVRLSALLAMADMRAVRS